MFTLDDFAQFLLSILPPEDQTKLFMWKLQHNAFIDQNKSLALAPQISRSQRQKVWKLGWFLFFIIHYH